MKRKKGQPWPIATITLTVTAQKILKELCWTVYEKQNIKHTNGTNRIKLALPTKTLLTTDVPYSKVCYAVFCSMGERSKNKNNSNENFTTLVQLHANDKSL